VTRAASIWSRRGIMDAKRRAMFLTAFCHRTHPPNGRAPRHDGLTSAWGIVLLAGGDAAARGRSGTCGVWAWRPQTIGVRKKQGPLGTWDADLQVQPGVYAGQHYRR